MSRQNITADKRGTHIIGFNFYPNTAGVASGLQSDSNNCSVARTTGQNAGDWTVTMSDNYRDVHAQLVSLAFVGSGVDTSGTLYGANIIGDTNTLAKNTGQRQVRIRTWSGNQNSATDLTSHEVHLLLVVER